MSSESVYIPLLCDTPTSPESIEHKIDHLKQQLSDARRAVPHQPVGAYTFRDRAGKPVTLRELFGSKRDLLIVHNMGRGCTYCTLWADGFNGLLPAITDRTAFALSSPDEPDVMAAFADERGWSMPIISEAGTTFRYDMGFHPEPNRRMPGVSAFHLHSDGQIVRTGRASFGPLDDFCPVWPLFDLLKDGVGTWQPKYWYS